MTVKANAIIDELIGLNQEFNSCIYEARKLYPNGQYMHNETPYYKCVNYFYREKASSKILMLTYLLGIDATKAERIARKWYERTNWQKCLTDETAERIIDLCQMKI